MSRTELVQKAFSLIEAGKLLEAGEMFSDDFTFSGTVPEPMRKQQYLDYLQTLLNAFPDWKFNADGWQERGDAVKLKLHVTGTHTNILLLPFKGMGSIAPTGTRFALPEEPAEAVVRGRTITALKVKEVSGGGVEGILRQLAEKTEIPVPSV
ncbi:MAG: nuclear transport factor 2 family protein [Endomicrobiales bacterium]